MASILFKIELQAKISHYLLNSHFKGLSMVLLPLIMNSPWESNVGVFADSADRYSGIPDFNNDIL
jgi:hypothetical protein